MLFKPIHTSFFENPKTYRKERFTILTPLIKRRVFSLRIEEYNINWIDETIIFLLFQNLFQMDKDIYLKLSLECL